MPFNHYDKKLFQKALERAHDEGRRIVAPLVGFPGLNMTGSTIKLAQQDYGKHYRAMKAIAEVFQPDVQFPLMDLSVEANALGRYTLFPTEDSATVIKEEFSLDELPRKREIDIVFDTRLIGNVETVRMMGIGLPSSIMKGAYVIGPYSLAGLIMGADDAAMATIMEPEKLHTLVEFTTERIQEYVRLLISSGAQVVCILEPSAVMLGPDQFEEFSSNYVAHIVRSYAYTGVATVYHTCGNTMYLVEKMAESGVDGLSLDSPEAGVDLPAIVRRIPKEVALIGNLNPTGSILRGLTQDVKKDVAELLNQMEHCTNFVLSTGCDLPQETPLENIGAFMEAGRAYRLPSN